MTNENIRQKTARTGSHGITATEMAECCRQVTAYLEDGKRFCSVGFSMWELSRGTGIPVKIISRSINTYLGLNFYAFINRLRVEEAKALLRGMAATGSQTMIDSVGEQCGFRSRSVFFSRFREYEKITPQKYMNLYSPLMLNLKKKQP